MLIDSAFMPPVPMSNGNDNAEPGESFPPATLLAVLEASLQETIVHFSEVSGKISERVLRRGLMSDVELIVGLQALDRLQQELVAYTGIVNHCAVVLSSPQDGERPADPIEAITLADLKKRMHDRCRNEMAMLSSASDGASF